MLWNATTLRIRPEFIKQTVFEWTVPKFCKNFEQNFILGMTIKIALPCFWSSSSQSSLYFKQAMTSLQVMA